MNFEDNIKDKLESRRIEPTASAWDRIEGKLEASKGKKKSKVVLWTGIAASFIAGVFITMLLVNSSTQDIERDFVVSPDIEKTKQEIETPGFNPVLKKESEVVIVNIEEAALTEEEETVENPVIKKKDVNKTPKTSRVTVVKTQTILANTVINNDKPIENQVLKDAIETTVDIKVNEAVATVDAVTDEEVDALLASAQKEIISSRAFDTKTNTVTANGLLLDAEAEVDPETFKDKIFKTIKTGLNKAVEAVVTKDN